MEELVPREVAIGARDGFPLAGSIFGTGEPGGRVVIISSATGAARRFYRHFAGYLAAAGYTVVTYDYRGIGDSRPDNLRDLDARMRDWALLDMAGVVDWVERELDASRILLVGHSVGGQAAGMLDNADRIHGMVTMSAQSGYWKLQGGMQKLSVAFHVHLTLPLLSKLVGYMPWSWIGAGQDLPRGVALEWARWCRNPRYLLGDDSLPVERYQQFAAPVLAYSFADDHWGTRKSVVEMMSAYPDVEYRHIIPGERGLDSIGHFGYFRPASRSLWAEVVDWFETR